MHSYLRDRQSRSIIRLSRHAPFPSIARQAIAKQSAERGDVCNICTPFAREEDLIGPVNHHVPQQIGPDFMLRMFLAGVGGLIDWNQAHKPHQQTNPVMATSVVIALHVPGHLARSGLVPLTFRSLNSFRRPFVRMPRGFCRSAMNVADAGYRTH